ncbi:hypothetical protein AVEN_100238-1, partial [Araneus ventricosus]
RVGRQKRETRRAKRLRWRLDVNQVEGKTWSFAVVTLRYIVDWDFGNFGVCYRGKGGIKFDGELVDELFKGGNVKGTSSFISSLIPVYSGYHSDRFILQGLKFVEVGFSSAGPDWACIGDNWAKIDAQFVVDRKSRVPAN